MKQIMIFVKKEFMELTRTGKLTLLLILFVLFGIMSPALAKLTPIMFEAMGDTLAEQGIVMQKMTVDAFTSWGQYYKNVFMEPLVIIAIFSAILTNEYQRGTLVHILTKGLSRYKVIAAKTIVLLLTWTLCYWLCFGIVYGYTAYFWDNSVVQHVLFAGACIYILGIWLLAVLILASTFCSAGFAVMLIVGGAFGGSYLLGLIPAISKFLPTQLMNAGQLLDGSMQISAMMPAIWASLGMCILFEILSIMAFNKKQL